MNFKNFFNYKDVLIVILIIMSIGIKLDISSIDGFRHVKWVEEYKNGVGGNESYFTLIHYFLSWVPLSSYNTILILSILMIMVHRVLVFKILEKRFGSKKSFLIIFSYVLIPFLLYERFEYSSVVNANIFLLSPELFFVLLDTLPSFISLNIILLSILLNRYWISSFTLLLGFSSVGLFTFYSMVKKNFFLIFGIIISSIFFTNKSFLTYFQFLKDYRVIGYCGMILILNNLNKV